MTAIGRMELIRSCMTPEMWEDAMAMHGMRAQEIGNLISENAKLRADLAEFRECISKQDDELIAADAELVDLREAAAWYLECEKTYIGGPLWPEGMPFERYEKITEDRAGSLMAIEEEAERVLCSMVNRGCK